MALKASIGVLLGCQFGAANRLLAAAERGDDATVSQVLKDKPFLAAFTGFHGTTSALHRAAAAGHLGVCRCIVEPLKARVRDAEAAAAKRGAAASSSPVAAKWRRLLSTVLNQRSHKSLTPLMLACEHGHAGVAAYLLREGADPLATDFAHSRTCLHYAAVGGHADCLRLLCSDSALVAGADGSSRPLRDVVVSDMQVQACRFIDQRAFGGLTALHFAAVTGSLEAVQALLRAGASIMVKSDGEAYIGEDHLVPGSTPLHVAVIVNSLSIVHAILQAHMEMMNILGTRLDERGRRPWEGSSRTDIRSVRNQFRKLPFHLARERHQPQLMSLVDPRIPIDVALDAARDTEHGIGPKRLGTICSLVLQRSLLQWLDDCQTQLAAEKQAAAAAGGAAPLSRQPSAMQQALAAVRGAGRRRTSSSKPPLAGSGVTSVPGSRPGSAVPSTRPSPVANSQVPAVVLSPATQQAGEASPRPSGLQRPVPEAGAAAPAAASASASPFAALAALPTHTSPFEQRRQQQQQPVSASAPATPARDLAALQQHSSGPLTVGALPSLPAEDQAGASDLNRMASASLHGYMSLLSIKRPQSSRSLDATQRSQVAAALGRAPASSLPRQLSANAQQLALAGGGNGNGSSAQVARVRFLSEPGVAAADAMALAQADAAAAGSRPESPRVLAGSFDLDDSLPALPSPSLPSPQQGNTIMVLPQTHHRRSSSQTNVRLGSVFGRLRSPDGTPAGPDALAAAATAEAVTSGAAAGAGSVHAAALAAALLGEKHSEKDLGLDSEGELPSPDEDSEDDAEDVECGVCLDALVEVAFASCQHKLCLECARNLTRQDKKPPHCPFCRRLVIGFQRVSAVGGTPHTGQRDSSRRGIRAVTPAAAAPAPAPVLPVVAA